MKFVALQSRSCNTWKHHCVGRWCNSMLYTACRSILNEWVCV